MTPNQSSQQNVNNEDQSVQNSVGNYTTEENTNEVGSVNNSSLQNTQQSKKRRIQSNGTESLMTVEGAAPPNAAACLDVMIEKFDNDTQRLREIAEKAEAKRIRKNIANANSRNKKVGIFERSLKKVENSVGYAEEIRNEFLQNFGEQNLPFMRKLTEFFEVTHEDDYIEKMGQ